MLYEDYAYLLDWDISETIRRFLEEAESDAWAYEQVKKILNKGLSDGLNRKQILPRLKELCRIAIGRDIFKQEIRIIDGHDSSGCFWIMPVRVLDYSDTNDIDTVAEMRQLEISIEDEDVAQYLLPFLKSILMKNLKPINVELTHQVLNGG